ncbi:hypothetical protein [Actinoplanes sp. NPDC026623]|uniref:hypothetical protein n=1 Tax=Actinoplanes sp. NPDC026623 TaxID=3155610 RepID=UPI0033FDFE3B
MTAPARARVARAVLTFLAGVVLGAAVFALIRPGPDAEPRGPRVTSRSASRPAQVRSPSRPAAPRSGAGPCALASGDEAAGALRRLHTARLQPILNELQQAQNDVDRLAEQCRRESRSGK